MSSTELFKEDLFTFCFFRKSFNKVFFKSIKKPQEEIKRKMSLSRTTIRTVERGVRIQSRSRERVTTKIVSRNESPADLHVKQQIHAFVDQSHLEKNELNKLNERMAAYLNRVKALENENGKLKKDVGEVQLNWGDETRKIRETYEQSLFDLRGRIDDVSNLKTLADIRNKRAQYENQEYQKRTDDIGRLNENERNKIKNLERELVNLRESNVLLKKSIDDQISDIEKYRHNRDEAWTNLVDLLDKLDEELFRRIAVEYNNQTLREHIEFVKQVNEREINEMNQLSEALPFNDQIEFYKDQLKRVINNIRKDYEQLHMEQTREMEEWMRVKTEELAAKAREKDPVHELEMEIQLENIENLRETFDLNLKEIDMLRKQHEAMSKQLQAVEQHVEVERSRLNETLSAQNDEAQRLNDDLNTLLNDYNAISTNKASLEYEMQVYKRLLDSQFDRVSAPQPIAAAPANTEQAKSDSNVTSNAYGGKVQNKKEKKGSIGISDSSPDGKYIIIENVGSNTVQVDLSGWQIRRKVDGNTEITYKIPAGTALPPNKELTVWASSYHQSKSTSDLVAEFENWGIGINSISRLYNTNGEEKSSFYQQITFSSRF